jgi:hypothetical protein
VSGAYQGLYPELWDVPRSAAKLAVEGAAWYEKKVEALPAPSGDDVDTLFGKKSCHQPVPGEHLRLERIPRGQDHHVGKIRHQERSPYRRGLDDAS